MLHHALNIQNFQAHPGGELTGGERIALIQHIFIAGCHVAEHVFQFLYLFSVFIERFLLIFVYSVKEFINLNINYQLIQLFVIFAPYVTVILKP
jgi:hypothetical protein